MFSSVFPSSLMRPRRQSLQCTCKVWKVFCPQNTGFPSEQRWLVGNRKWSCVITVSHWEGQHDVTEHTAINSHIHSISCHRRPGYRYVVWFFCFFFTFFNVSVFFSWFWAFFTFSDFVPPSCPLLSVHSQRAVDGRFLPGLILARRLVVNIWIAALPELNVDVR